MLLRARIVLPVSRPPLEDGAVVVAGSRIQAVRRWAEVPPQDRASVVDLGEAILLPGLINAHCHLDYTHMAGLIPPPRRFPDWIKAMVALKGSWTSEDFARSWLAGARMLLRHGVTTVADVEAVPKLVPGLWARTPLRVISLRELIGFKDPTLARETVEKALSEWSAVPESQGRLGLSPHAPYTTRAELLRAAADAARQRHWPLVIHVAESEAEYQMFVSREGPLFEWLKGQRDMSDCGHGTPVQHLEQSGCLGENLLAVHANYLSGDDFARLSRNQVSVAHCPRCHEYFKHSGFPRKQLARAGVNLCLGTDSLASIVKPKRDALELDLFAEMQTLASKTSDLPPETILRMATVNGAQALGWQGRLGELSPGARADLIAIQFGGKAEAACEAVAQCSGEVRASMIDGRWAIAPAP